VKTNRDAAERGLRDGAAGMLPESNPYRNRERRELWERGRRSGAAGGYPCGAIYPHAPTLRCLCGHCPPRP
jgi:ribosome modulation factor